MSEWGNPAGVVARHPGAEVSGGQPGELKHLSTRRKRNEARFAEWRRAKGEEPKPWDVEACGVVGPVWGVARLLSYGSRSGLERPDVGGESPVGGACGGRW